jgi:hypothetical protein
MSSMSVSLPPNDSVNGSYFIQFAANKTSQGGEDGVLSKIFEFLRLNENPSRMCVDVGAWDGVHLSNTHSLLWDSDHPWGGVLIEADIERCHSMQVLYSEKPEVVCVGKHADVWNENNNFTAEHLLKNILLTNNVPLDFDFLSIDVDGADYHLWQQLSSRRCGEDGGGVFMPKVVCIEFNPSIPNCVHFVQECDTRVHQGNSLLALTELGARLGYELVATTTFNAIFVRLDLYSERILPQLQRAGVAASPSLAVGGPGVKSLLDILHPPASMYTYMFQTYDGELKFAGSKKLIWHKLALNPQQLQMLPVRDRKFPYEPQYEVLLDEVKAEVKAFLREWSLLSPNPGSGGITDGVGSPTEPLRLVEAIAAAAAKLLPVACVRDRLMEILAVLIYTLNADALEPYTQQWTNSGAPAASTSVQAQVALLRLLTTRHEVWLRALHLFATLFLERGNVYFHLTAGEFGGSRGAQGQKSNQKKKYGLAEDLGSALRWYKEALAVLQPVSELLCTPTAHQADLPPGTSADSADMGAAASDYLRMAERCLPVLGGALFADVALLLAQCCRCDRQLMESARFLAVHRRAQTFAAPATGVVRTSWLVKKAVCLVSLHDAHLGVCVGHASLANSCDSDCGDAELQSRNLAAREEDQKLRKIITKCKYANNLV